MGNEQHPISPFGNPPNQENLPGLLLGDLVGLDGTSNVVSWLVQCSEKGWTSILVESIWLSPITTTRSLNQRSAIVLYSTEYEILTRPSFLLGFPQLPTMGQLFPSHGSPPHRRVENVEIVEKLYHDR